MSGWRCPVRITFALAGLSAFVTPVSAHDPLPTAPAPRLSIPDPARLRREAEAAEKAGNWEKALDLYLQLFSGGRDGSDLRERIRVCLRHVAQISRQRDPAFQHYVLSLKPAQALDLYAEVVEKLSSLYADRDRSTAGRLFAHGLVELDRALGDPAFRKSHLVGATDARVKQFRAALRDTWKLRLPANPREARPAAFELVREARDQLGAKNGAAVVFELLCGACTGLDEFTAYVAPVGDPSEFASPILELAAYGLLVRVVADELLVEGVIPASYAALHTTLRKGDRVIRVNGRSLESGNPASLALALRNSAMFGHELELPPTDVPAAPVRLPVPLPTVYGASVVRPMEGVGYLRLASIRDTTAGELDDAVISLKARGVRVLVIDARGNTGGSFPGAIQVAQRFLPGGIVVTTQGQAPDFANRVFSSDAGMTAFDLPVVLLIDTKTMSAAEAVAAAWKEHNRATLVGLPTFGKGAIQSPVRLTAADGPHGPRSGVLVLTVATMFGPRGGPINGAGVVPHVLEADAGRQLDVAIAKAVELVGGGMR